ncbi:hypothetical protein QQF64_029424 [Cirrhinus molitorella]|uniref:Uncharacterized protein n=1 Tax=Cirrhinus molitorella TaxID=172907 RepID=A0ABR3N0I0_9TELE
MFLDRDHDCVDAVQAVSSASVNDLSMTGFHLTANIWVPQLCPNSLFSGGRFNADPHAARNASEPNGIGAEPNGPQAERSAETHIHLQTGVRHLQPLAAAELTAHTTVRRR